ncbi:MAG TPA: G/U mismatch-specific DNA glycosylase [Solirubrobacterales bacterium]|nr:G/U mismatch-specific DNA glycosylase [Solirubrobacterales bacterium]
MVPRDAPWRPTKVQLEAATRKKVRDLIQPDLDVLFCGINPGRYSAAVGHHFAGPGNLFWPTLFAAGFTPRRFTAFEDAQLLPLGFGITNFVARASAAASELHPDELRAGARTLTRKVRRYTPRFVAFLGLQAYRLAFDRRKAQVGLQPELIGPSRLWLLPNPSGLNAHHQPPILKQMFSELLASVRSESEPESR